MFYHFSGLHTPWLHSRSIQTVTLYSKMCQMVYALPSVKWLLDCFTLGHTKLMLCFTDQLPSQGDPAGREKLKKVCYETICITKITMIAKYLEDTTSVHSQLANSTFLSHICNASVLNNSNSLNFIKLIFSHSYNELTASSAIFPSHYNNHMIYIFI